MEDFAIYSYGIVYCSVCSSLSIEETTKRVNKENPTGSELRWQLSKNPTFASGTPHPCPCHDAPDTHKHYLFVC